MVTGDVMAPSVTSTMPQQERRWAATPTKRLVAACKHVHDFTIIVVTIMRSAVGSLVSTTCIILISPVWTSIRACRLIDGADIISQNAIHIMCCVASATDAQPR
jgi:hypothetical protein